MVRVGEIPTDENFEARIVIDLFKDSFSVLHTSNIDIAEVYAIFVAAVEYMDTMMGDAPTSKYLN